MRGGGGVAEILTLTIISLLSRGGFSSAAWRGWLGVAASVLFFEPCEGCGGRLSALVMLLPNLSLVLVGGRGGGGLDEIGALIIVLINVVGGGGVADVGQSKSSTEGGRGFFSAAKKLQIKLI